MTCSPYTSTLEMKKLAVLRNAYLPIVLLVILCLFSTACSDHYNEKYDPKSMVERYKNWLKQHGRRYADEEEWNLRFGIYQANVKLIEFVNSRNLSYRLTDNEFADLTNQEFRSKYLGYKKHWHSDKKNNFTFYRYKLPGSIDWRKRGAVNPVKNQGNCGSCWAFSAVAAVESLNKIKTGKLVSLSEQELVDCNVNKDNQGCHGGYMEKAYDFIKRNGGITTEKDYPYAGKDGKCKSAKKKVHAVTISGYKSVPHSNEMALQAAVAKQPVSVAIDAGGYDFQLYSRGVFSGSCGKTLNHGVAIVGYGVEDGKKYWLVRNSWGSSWGEAGYIKMKRGSNDKNGICGIAMEASYPVKGS